MQHIVYIPCYAHVFISRSMGVIHGELNMTGENDVSFHDVLEEEV